MGSKRKAVRKWEGAEQVASAGWRRLQKSKMERKRAQKTVLACAQQKLLFTFQDDKDEKHHASVNNHCLLLMKNCCQISSPQ